MTTTARGYGAPHQAERRAAAKHHNPADPCARCGHPLGPMGPWLHYDHDDTRTGYLGFSHGDNPCPMCGHRCNKRAGAIRKQQLAKGAVPQAFARADRW